MARTKGTFNFSANLEPKVQAPLDARTVVGTVAELTQAATWQDSEGKAWLYDGMVVTVNETQTLYMLTNKDNYASAAAWKVVGKGSEVFQIKYIAPTSEREVMDEAFGAYGTWHQALMQDQSKAKVLLMWYVGADGSYNIMPTVKFNASAGQGYTLSWVVDGKLHEYVLNQNMMQWASCEETVKPLLTSDSAGNGLQYASDKLSLKIDQSGNVSLSTSANGLKAEYQDLITNIDSADKVLGLSATKLSATVSMDYDSGTKTIRLKGKGGAVISTVDASDFIKDGMVQSVELSGNNLVFTFNTDAGQDVISVDLSKFIDVYTAGNGVSITGKAIGVKCDTSSESYLQVTSAGVKVSGIDAAIEAAITEAFTWHEA